MELVFWGPDDSICFIDSAGEKRPVRKGRSLPRASSHNMTKLYILESGDLSEKADSFLLFVQCQNQGPFLIVLSNTLPEKLQPCIHTRGHRQSFFVQKDTNSGQATHLALYAGEELEVRLETGTTTRTIRLKAVIDKARDDNEHAFLSQIGNFICKDAPLPRDEDSPHRYLIHVPGHAHVADYFIKQLALRDTDTPDKFANTAEAFRKRANQIARYKEVWSHHYVQIVDPNGGENIYREPFVLFKYELLNSKTPTLKDYIEHRSKYQPPGHTATSAVGMGYDAAWSVLTQVAWVSKVFHDDGASGHGELTPDNVLLRPSGEDGQLEVIVCDFAYDVSQKPLDGFFVADAAADELKDWHLRDRFALGSLFYYMIKGRAPDPCMKDGIANWREKHIDRLNDHPDVAMHPIAGFLRKAWSLERPAKSDLLKALDLPSMHPALPESPTDQRPTLRPWMLLLGIALFFFTLVDVTAFSAWRNQAPLGLEFLRAFMSVAAPLPTNTPTRMSIPLPPTLTFSPTTTWTPSPTMTSTPSTARATPTPTVTLTATSTASRTPTATSSPTASVTSMPSRTSTSTSTSTRSVTPTRRPSVTPIPTFTITPLVNIAPSASCGRFARIVSPENWQVITGDFDVVGQAYLDKNHPKGFGHYQLDYMPLDQPGGIWVSLARPEDRPDEPHQNTRLATFRVANLKNGRYAIKLRVVDKEGHYDKPEYPDCIVVFTLDK